MNTREAILELGEHLFRKQGFNAFSYYDLAQSLNIRPAAIHYHFPAKDDLAFAILQRERENFHRFAEETNREKDIPSRLKKFVRTFAPHAEAGRICMVGASGADYFSFSEKTHNQIKAMASEIISWLQQNLSEGKSSGAFNFSGTSKTRAMIIATNMAASLHLSRILGKQYYDQIARQIIEDICTKKSSPSKITRKKKS